MYEEKAAEERAKGAGQQDTKIVPTEHALSAFSEDWLFGTHSISMDRHKATGILGKAQRLRNALFMLLAQEEYTVEERMNLLAVIHNLLKLEEDIRYAKDGKYFSRNELHILFENTHTSRIIKFSFRFSMNRIHK